MHVAAHRKTGERVGRGDRNPPSLEEERLRRAEAMAEWDEIEKSNQARFSTRLIWTKTIQARRSRAVLGQEKILAGEPQSGAASHLGFTS